MAQFTTFTVAGTNVLPFLRNGSLRVSHKGNGRDVARFTFEHNTPNAIAAFRAQKRDAVVIEIDGDEEFTGIVWETEVEKIVEQRGFIRQYVTCVDRSALLDVVLINSGSASDNLGDVVVEPIANLSPHGVTLSGSQAAGPVVASQTWEFLTIRAVVDKLANESLWVWRVNDTEFIMLEPGTEAAPFILGDATAGSYRTIRFKDTLTGYYNEGWLRYGSRGLQLLEETFEGDGVTTSFPLTEVLVLLGSDAAPQITPRGVVVVTRSGPTVSDETTSLVGGGGAWEYDPANGYDNTINHVSGAVLGAGEFITIQYQWNGPGQVFARDAGQYSLYGPWTKLIDVPAITRKAEAEAALAGALQKFTGDKVTATILTTMAGLKPFQVLTIEIDDHLTANDFLILETELQQVTHGTSLEHHLEWRVIAVKGNVWRGNWEEFWRTSAEQFGTGGAPVVAPTPQLECSAAGATLAFEQTWNAASTPADGYDAMGTADDNIQLVSGVGASSSQAVQRIASGSSGQNVLAKTGLTAYREGCQSVVYQNDGGTNDTLLMQCSGPAGMSITVVKVSTEAIRLNVLSNGASTTLYTGANNSLSTTELQSIRLQFKISTHLGGASYDTDAYVRLYLDGVLLHETTGTTIRPTGTSGAGFTAIQIRVLGIMDNHRLYTIP
jgi:hypothetical protein